MNHHEIQEEAEDRPRKANWAMIAAWTFGSWALLVPLAAGIVVSGQNQTLANQEKILTQIAALREDTMEKNATQDAQLATLTANQAMVLQWKARLESAGVIH
jgi:hypothetical protein